MQYGEDTFGKMSALASTPATRLNKPHIKASNLIRLHKLTVGPRTYQIKNS